jgi:hypothetical protein
MPCCARLTVLLVSVSGHDQGDSTASRNAYTDFSWCRTICGNLKTPAVEKTTSSSAINTTLYYRVLKKRLPGQLRSLLHQYQCGLLTAVLLSAGSTAALCAVCALEMLLSALCATCPALSS